MGAFDWSVTAARNAVADPLVRALDGASARELPGLVRGVQAGVARFAADLGGAIRTGGTANAYTARTASGVSELRPGLSVKVQVDRDNTGAASMNVDGTGPKPWLAIGGGALSVGALRQDRFVTVTYDADLDAWRSDAGVALGNDDLAAVPALTLKGNAAAGSSTPVDLTVDQSRGLLGVDKVSNTSDHDKVQPGNPVGDALAGKATPADVDAALTPLQTSIAYLAAGQQAGSLAYDTLAQLTANLAPADGATAQVLADGTNNGFYAKVGGAGAGNWVKKSAATVTALDTRVSQLAYGFGDLYSLITPLPQLASPTGAFPSTIADGRTMGAYIIQGGTGADALVEYRFPLSYGPDFVLAGRVLQLSLLFSVNAAFARSLTVGLNVVGAGGSRSTQLLSYTSTRIAPTQILVDLTFQATGDETALSPYAINFTAAAQPQDDYFTLIGIVGRVQSSPSQLTTVADENIRLAFGSERTARNKAIGAAQDSALSTAIRSGTQKGRVYDRSWSIKADGSGDFLSPAQASLNAAPATPTKKALFSIAPGVYGDVEWHTADSVDMRVAGGGIAHLRGDQPDNTPLALIETNSVFRLNTQTNLFGLRITMRNGRYAVHPDLSGTNPDLVYQVWDCWIEHFGNQGARDYQASIGGDRNAVWSTTNAWGMGTASGQIWNFKRNTFVSAEAAAFAAHNFGNFEVPSQILHTNCRFISKVRRTSNTTGSSINLASIGSRQKDNFDLLNCEMSGPIIASFRPWIPVAPVDQVADKSEWQITGSGCTPVPFVMYDDGSRALRIDSADTSANSEVAVSGSAVAVLFGSLTTVRPGGGLQGGVYGSWDVGEHPVGIALDHNITALGYRLGDCTAQPLTLTVQANGATATITFDQDYRAQSNATIMAKINAALGANATASLFWVSELYRPSFRDQEAYLYNADTVVIRRKRAVAYTTGDRSVRVMTPADPAAIFAGIAYEDIRPGEWGRVKTRGQVAVSMDMDRTDGAAFDWGDTFGVGDAAGRFVKGASVPLLTATNAVDVRWEARSGLLS